jgi:ABC-type amino acid transport substrate-binding protein
MMTRRRHHAIALGSAIAILVAAPLMRAQKTTSSTAATSTSSSSHVGTLDAVRDTGHLRLGYRPDARPFSYKGDSGQPAGYSVALCQTIADGIKGDLGLSNLTIDWVPVSLDERFRALQANQIDMLCGADSVTLSRRADVSFSIPIFPGGIGALIRSDAPYRLREVLAGHGETFRPTWRASATQLLQTRAFSVVSGTTAERWLNERFSDLHIVADISRTDSYDTAIRAVLDRRSDVVVGERAILLDAAQRHDSARDLLVVDRLFTYEPLALALRRDDEPFRLAVDRLLSRQYRDGHFADLYAKSFGEPDEATTTFYRWNALPE